MSDYFEGDLIRPLGQVTLYFGYAEAQVNLLLVMLRDCGVRVEVSAVAPLGQRLAEMAAAVRRLTGAAAAEVLGLLEESKQLIDRRNLLVHASVLAQGRVTPNDSEKSEFRVTPEALTDLAEQAFNWKERLNAAVQLRLLPELRETAINGTGAAMTTDTENSTRRTRLVEALRSLTPEMRNRLAELKAQGGQIRSRRDLIWHLVLESFSTMGNSRGYDGLFGNADLVASSTFESVVSVPHTKRKAYLEDILRRAKIRMPSMKAERLVANVEMIVAMGGLEAARQNALGLVGREAKLTFMKSFHGIGDKYGRNVWMIQYDPDFRETIAVDERIKGVTEELGRTFRDYVEHEAFYCQIATESNLEPWEVDRLLYWFRDHFVSAIRRVNVRAA